MRLSDVDALNNSYMTEEVSTARELLGSKLGISDVSTIPYIVVNQSNKCIKIKTLKALKIWTSMA
jgi:hypothetical protein